jgi:hypothetical protein
MGYVLHFSCHARESGHPVNTNAEDAGSKPTFTGSSAFAEDDNESSGTLLKIDLSKTVRVRG